MLCRVPFGLIFVFVLAPACDRQPASTPPSAPATAATASQPTIEHPAPSPIPEAFDSLTPQLSVPDVEAAIHFCRRAFGATQRLTIPHPDGTLVHAQVQIGESIVMLDRASDPQMKSPRMLGGTPVTLMVYVPDAEAVFDAAVVAGATVEMPLTEQFWGDRYGQIIDPFGHRWAIATHLEDLTEAQMQERTELMMKEMAAQQPSKGEPLDKNNPGEPVGPPVWKSVQGTPAAEPVPAEYGSVTLALTVADARATIAFYETAFGAKVRNMMPMPDGKLMHAEVKIGDAVLMLADEMPAMGSVSPLTLGGTPVMIHHYVADADAIFAQAQAAGAQTIMPLEHTFWGDRYAMVADPSGYPWAIATQIEQVPPEDLAQRLADYLKNPQ